MPSIPQYEQQTDARGSINAQASGNDFGAQVGQGLGNLAAGAEAAYMGTEIRAKADAAVLKQQEERQARSWSGVGASQASVDSAQMLADAKAAAAPGAPGFTPAILDKFDAYSTKLIDTAPTLSAKQFLTDHMSTLRAHVGQQAVEFQASSVYHQNVANADTTIENSAKVVQQDPTQYALTLQLVKSTMPDVGGAKSAELTLAATKQLTTAAATSTLDQNPYALRDATSKAMGQDGFSGPTGVPWIDDASSEQVNTWNKLAKAKIVGLENTKVLNANAAEAAAAAEHNKFSDMVNSGQVPSLDYISKVRGITQGTSVADDTELLIQKGISGNGFGSQSLPAQARILADLDAKAAAHGTDPDSVAARAQLEKINSTQQAAYRENPLDAASRFAHVAVQPLQDVTSPAQALMLAAQRSSVLPKVEAAAGVPVSPFQPGEAAQLTKLVQTLPTDQQATFLTTLGQTVGSQSRIAAVAKQLSDKDGTIGLAMAYAGAPGNGAPTSTLGTQVAQYILDGDRALKLRTSAEDSTKQTGWKASIATALRGVYPNQQLEDASIDAAFKIAAARSAAGQGEDIDTAVNLATGGIITHGKADGKIPLPYGMHEDEFNKRLAAITPESLSGYARGGVVMVGQTQVPLEKFVAGLPDATLVHAGQGRYNVRAGSGYVTDLQGRPITLQIAP